MQMGRLSSANGSCYNVVMKPIPINEKLVWDYDIPDDAQENEAFREWYVTRVLTTERMPTCAPIGFSDHPRLSAPPVFAARDQGILAMVLRPTSSQDRYGDLDPVSARSS